MVTLAQLPQIQQVNFAPALRSYYQGQQQQRRDELADKQLQLADSNLQMQQMRLQDYERQAGSRALQDKLQVVAADTQMQEIGKQWLMNIDTESPDFDKQVVDTVKAYEQALVQRYQFSPEEASQIGQTILRSGAGSKEAITQLKIEKGLMSKPKGPSHQVIDGQLVTIDGGRASAQPISGFSKDDDEPNTTVGKLLAEQGEYEEGSSEWNLYQRAIEKETAMKNGATITTADGTTVTLGGAAQPFGKATQNKVEGEAFDASNRLVRLNQIQQSFNDSAEKFLTAQGKAEFWRIKKKDQIGQELSEYEKAYQEEASSFFFKALTNMNQTLNELSGAAVSVQEFERISQALPNPGKEGLTNLFSGDGKTQFDTKLKEAIKLQKMAIARYTYIQKHGLEDYVSLNKKGEIISFADDKGNSIGLDDMPKLMKRRVNEIAAQIKQQNQNISHEELGPMVRKQYQEEFGLVGM